MASQQKRIMASKQTTRLRPLALRLTSAKQGRLTNYPSLPSAVKTQARGLKTGVKMGKLCSHNHYLLWLVVDGPSHWLLLPSCLKGRSTLF